MHPRWVLDADDGGALAIWQAWRGGGGGGLFGAVGGGGHLPFAGGIADQPACTMATLRFMDRIAAALGSSSDRPRT